MSDCGKFLAFEMEMAGRFVSMGFSDELFLFWEARGVFKLGRGCLVGEVSG